jgi:hypothetical protein
VLAHPLHHAPALPERRLHGAPTRDALEEHHAEAVVLYTSLLVVILVMHPYSAPENSIHGVPINCDWRNCTEEGNELITGSDVLVRSGERRRRRVGAVVGDPGEAKVGEARLVSLAEQDVVGLDVAVEDGRHAVVVEVREALGHADGDREPHLPVHHGGTGHRAVQQATEGAVGEVVVEEEARAAVGGPAQEPDDVGGDQAALHVAHADLQLLVQRHVPRRRHLRVVLVVAANPAPAGEEEERPGGER